ncbi:hypothetical protein [Methylobacterium crusticola]|uniref:hypothetical protein n=1 Tax=Methylobacterium crusticola TaxID=1697972 RepID=UPI001EE18246|nr:hypothetical protein [Methylobacterium crusticola]
MKLDSRLASVLLARIRRMFDRVGLQKGEDWSLQAEVAVDKTVLYIGMSRSDLAELLHRAIPVLARPVAPLHAAGAVPGRFLPEWRVTVR